MRLFTVKHVFTKLLILLPMFAFSIYGQTIGQNTKISGNWFLAYNYNDISEINKFHLKRGYFTIKTKMSDVFSVRYTQDITLDQEGGDAGNVEIRLKYLYLKMELDHYNLFKDSYLEVGLVHRPWLDFEQNINRYRVQGKMFLERYSIISSADFGLFYSGLIGGEMDEDYQQNVNNKYPGRLGSYAIGIHNGGGYHAVEMNNNKTIEGRFSLRPLPQAHPGMQISYAFTYGKANVEDNATDFLMNLFLISAESKRGVFTTQYFTGIGDFSGKYADENGVSFKNDGYSVFGELNIPNTNISLFGRYDEFISHQDTDVQQNSSIAGVAYKFLKNKILIDVDYQQTPDKTIKSYELALEIGF